MVAFCVCRRNSRKIAIIAILFLVIYRLKSYIFIEPYKSSDERSRVDPLRVVIVDEHQDALKYWFRAVKSGLINKYGNTLVHIDAHGDETPPQYIPGYPFFRFPENSQELHCMMQTNDDFIQGALMTGMFSRVIWIWPSWDEDSHSDAYVWAPSSSGWSSDPHDCHEPDTVVFCQCKLMNNKPECYHLNRSATLWKDAILKTRSCKAEVTYKWEMVRDKEAVKLMRTGEWISGEENVVLDIDQDFFGCESGAQVLLQNGIAWSIVDELNEILSQLFCIKDILDETAVNNILMKLLESIITHIKFSKNNRRLFNFILKRVKYVITKLPEISCPQSKHFRQKLLTGIARLLTQLDSDQLKTMQKVGFCLGSNKEDKLPIRFRYLQVCHGLNTPNESVITFHMPTLDELNHSFQRVKSLLTTSSSNIIRPNLVTIARSLRDGYTPKSLAPAIEKGLLHTVLKDVFGPLNVHYDQNLMGGKSGRRY